MLAALTFYSLVKAIHIVAVVLAFGVLFTYPLLVRMARRSDLHNLAFLHRMQELLGRAVITPAGTVVLLAGVYLALTGPFDFKQWWVGFGTLAIIVILGVGGGFLAPRERRLTELAQRDIAAAGDGEVRLGDDYRALARRVLTVQMTLALLALVTILAMVLGSRGEV